MTEHRQRVPTVTRHVGSAQPPASQIRWLHADDGVTLALHAWSTPMPQAVVFYIHGIQSHTGWLFETGPELAQRGIAVYALDRRGSGRSAGRRGHLPSVDVVLDDYASALANVRRHSPTGPLTVVGQSLGGSILAALCAGSPVTADGFVFCAPALGQQRRRYDTRRLAAIRAADDMAATPIGLADEDYTDEADYLAFMAADPLMLRHVTNTARAVLVGIEDRYMKPGPPIAGPVFLAMPECDPIIDLASVHAVLARIAPHAYEERFATRRHYIEFSADRHRYWDWLTEVALCHRPASP